MILDHIKYITFSQLMSAVESDMDSFADSGMIDRSKYIKVVRKVNSDLGIRINQEKEAIVNIKNYRGVLPDDFEYLQLALLCEQTPTKCQLSLSADAPKLVSCISSENFYNPCAACQTPCPEGSTASLCGSCYKIYEYQPLDVTYVYSNNTPVKLTKQTYKYCSTNCLNTLLHSNKYQYTLDLYDRVITLNHIKEGKVYINYITDMVNDNNEIIIVDHPLVNDFYEYSVKEKMLENFLLNSDADVSQKLQYVREQKKNARTEAINFVDMPEYTEIVEYQKAKRENFYSRYFKSFERY